MPVPGDADRQPKKILVVEDVAFNQELLVQLLEEDYEVVTANDGVTGLQMAEHEHPDLILMDLSLPRLDGWEATRRLKAHVVLRTIPVIALSAHAMRGDEAKALQSGCDAYLSKPLDEDLLFATLARFLEPQAALPYHPMLGTIGGRHSMDPSVVPSPSHPTERLVGTAPALETLRAQICRLARFDTVGGALVPTLLLQGETGTGKGLVARVTHDSGPRASGPFVEVNCAAIPETMLEAELFGFEAGAFTDAKRAKPSLFEAASRGTLFLDEIDALPLGLQGKLLTAIESKQIRRLGAVQAHAVDVKLIAATNAALQEDITTGRFRADLYHRLAVVVLTLPPLRQRQEDIVLLSETFLQQYTTAHGVPPKLLTPTATAWLQEYPWPGNVRELGHVMERLTLLHVGQEVDAATLTRLSLALPTSTPSQVSPAAASPAAATGDSGADETAQMRQALAQTGGNVVRAARLLGLSRETMRYRMLRDGLARSAPGMPPAPSRQPPPRSTSRPPASQQREREPDTLRPSTILIVDDEPVNVDYLEQELEDLGYVTVSARNGREALALVAATPPDLILLDVMMPEIDGFTVCRLLKSDEETRLIPIVMLTALDDINDRIKGIEASADDFLSKPVHPQELLARIQTALRLKHTMDRKLRELRRVPARFAQVVPETVKHLIAVPPETATLPKQV